LTVCATVKRLTRALRDEGQGSDPRRRRGGVRRRGVRRGSRPVVPRGGFRRCDRRQRARGRVGRRLGPRRARGPARPALVVRGPSRSAGHPCGRVPRIGPADRPGPRGR